VETEIPIRHGGNPPPALVHQVVVEAAQHEKVRQAGAAPVQPMLHVVGVQEARVGAPREGAAAVAQHQGATEGGWNAAGTPADVQRLPVVLDCHQAAVAGHPAKRFRGKCARQSLGKGDDM
jgi:hypothetical protein